MLIAQGVLNRDTAQPVENSMASSKKTVTDPAAPATSAGGAESNAQSATRVLRQFRRVFNTVKTHFQQVEKRVGIGGAQVWALHVIREHPGIGVNSLARALDVRQPTASNLVRSLTEQSLVVVRKEGQDRRQVQLHVLPAGLQVLRRAPKPFTGVLPQALAALDADVLTRLEADLGLLLEALGGDDRAASIPLSQIAAAL